MKFRCTECGYIGGGRRPKGGDGTAMYPRKHNANGSPCLGSFLEAEWLESDEVAKAKATAAAILRESTTNRREIIKWRKRNVSDAEIAVALGIPEDSPLFKQ